MFDAPARLTPEEREAWDALAPHAFRRKTLTPSTAFSFELLCRNVAVERALATTEAGSASHRGVVQRIDAELLRFDLSPNGKPHADAPKVERKATSLELLKQKRRALSVG